MAGGTSLTPEISLVRPQPLSQRQNRAQELNILHNTKVSDMEHEPPSDSWVDEPILLPVIGDNAKRTRRRRDVAESAQYRKIAIERSWFMAAKEAKNAEELAKLERMRSLASLGTTLDAAVGKRRSEALVGLFGPAPLDFRVSSNVLKGTTKKLG